MHQINVSEYYEKTYVQIFNSIERPNWRIWKLFDEDNNCYQNKYHITTPEKLLRFIKSCKNIKSIYVSVSQFLSPITNHGNTYNQKIQPLFRWEKIMKGKMHFDSIKVTPRYFYPRAYFIIKDNILIDSYFFIDLDGPIINGEPNLSIAQLDARKVINYMDHNPDYDLKELNFSGKKGIHLLYKEKNPRHIKDPQKRIQYYKNKKSRLAKELMKLRLKTIDRNHLNIMSNVYQVRAVPFSLKGTSVVTPLDINRFMKEDIYHILSIKPLQGGCHERSRLLRRKPMNMNVATKQYRKSNLPGSERDSLISSRTYFVDNMVYGLRNNYITVLKHNKSRFSINTLKRLQRLYNLSDFYIYSIGSYMYSINPKLVQFNRLIKIMRAAKSLNLSFFYTRKHFLIPVSNSVYQDGTIANSITYIGNLKSRHGLNDFHSKPHCDFLGLKVNHMTGGKLHEGVMQIA